MSVHKMGDIGGDDMTKFEARMNDGKEALKKRVEGNGLSIEDDYAKFETRILGERDLYKKSIEEIIKLSGIKIVGDGSDEKNNKYMKLIKLNPELWKLLSEKPSDSGFPKKYMKLIEQNPELGKHLSEKQSDSGFSEENLNRG